MANDTLKPLVEQFFNNISIHTFLDFGPNKLLKDVCQFSSISLDPPLVGFFPALSSTSWPKIEETGRFCVNVLGSEQLEICKRFAMSKAKDKFEGMMHSHSPGGLPVIDNAVAWIECDIEGVQTIGDHLLVVGRVTALDKSENGNPLIFFRGGYHNLAELTDIGAD